jgi:hypothetical protein
MARVNMKHWIGIWKYQHELIFYLLVNTSDCLQISVFHFKRRSPKVKCHEFTYKSFFKDGRVCINLPLGCKATENASSWKNFTISQVFSW